MILKFKKNVLNFKRNDTPGSCEHTGTPVLISKCHSNEREPGLLGETADSRAGAGEVNKVEWFYCSREEGSAHENDRDMSKEYWNQLRRVPTGQI